MARPNIQNIVAAASAVAIENDNLKEFRNKIICGDCLDIMSQIPSDSVDLVVTSPPYNLKNSTGNGMKDGRGGKWKNAELINGYIDYDDNMPHEKYVEWQKKCLGEMFRIIPENGAIFYNHKWRVQNGLLQDRHDIVCDFPVGHAKHTNIQNAQKLAGDNALSVPFMPEIGYLRCAGGVAPYGKSILKICAKSHSCAWRVIRSHQASKKIKLLRHKCAAKYLVVVYGTGKLSVSIISL